MRLPEIISTPRPAASRRPGQSIWLKRGIIREAIERELGRPQPDAPSAAAPALL